MDPLISNIAIGVVSGMIANPSDRKVKYIVEKIAERLKRGEKPINHDLQRAARRAYLEATLFVCESCMEEMGIAPKLLRRGIGDIVSPSDEFNALKKIHKILNQELNQVNDPDYIPPESPTDQEIELLIQPGDIPREERLQSLQDQLKESVIHDLYSWMSKHRWEIRIPDRLGDMIKNGWKKGEVAFDWFEVMSAFFTGILKNNEKLTLFFQTRLLLKLKYNDKQYRVNLQTEFEKLGKPVLEFIQKIDKTTEQINETTREILALLKSKLAILDEVPPNIPLPNDRTQLPVVCRLPKRHYMLYRSLGNAFVGRVSDLWNVYDSLQKGETTVVEGVGVVMGMGGLGKTQLAIEFVHRFGFCYPGGVFWIDAEQGIYAMIARIADSAGIEIDGRLDIREQMRQLWNGLNQLGAVLIVLDNFPETTPLEPWLPNSGGVHLMVTTRRRDLFRYSRISLDVLSLEEGLLLLNSGERKFGKEAEQLIEVLGGLPLALELAKHFLNFKTSVSIEKLLGAIQARGEMKALDLFAKKYESHLPSGHIREVGATIQLSWDLASDEAKQVLQAMSLLAPTPVPRRLLERILDFSGDDPLEDPLDDAIDELDKKLSLIDLDEAGDPRLHRLVGGFVRELSCYEETLHEKVVGVVEMEMARCRDDKDTQSYYELDKIVGHADALLSSKVANVENIIDISNYLSWHYKKKGFYRLAEKYGRISLELTEKHNEPGADSIALSKTYLALVLQDLGKLPEAELLLREALESAKKNFEPGHPTIAIRQSNLALVLMDLGKLPEAELLLREALESNKKNFEPGHPSIATRLHNLATVLKDMGKDNEAMAMEQEAYESWLACLGSDHPHTKIAKRNLDKWKRG